jgi:hypothetical protein
MFPVPNSTGPSLPPVVHVPQWQTDIGVAVLTMSSYQMDANADQEPDEDGTPFREQAPAAGAGFRLADNRGGDAESEEGDGQDKSDTEGPGAQRPPSGPSAHMDVDDGTPAAQRKYCDNISVCEIIC